VADDALPRIRPWRDGGAILLLGPWLSALAMYLLVRDLLAGRAGTGMMGGASRESGIGSRGSGLDGGPGPAADSEIEAPEPGTRNPVPDAGRCWPALIAGTIFALLPYRVEHLMHLELQWSQWMPLACWALHRTVQRGRIRDGVLTAAFVLAQFLSCIYYGIFLVMTLALVAPLLLLARERATLAGIARALVVGAVVCGPPLLMYAAPYRANQQVLGNRTAHDIERWSATPGSFVSVPGDGFAVHQSVLTRAGSPARVPAIGIVPAGWKAGLVVVWLDERGKEAAFAPDGRTPTPEVKRLLAGGAAVLVPDVFLTGEAGAIGSRIRVKNDDTYFGYNTGYNRSVFAERTSDVLTAIAFGKQLGAHDVALVGRGRAGAWALAARALAGDVVARTAVDLGGFDFDQVRETTDDALLSGALKYGGVRGLASLATTGRTTIFGLAPAQPGSWVPTPSSVTVLATAATADALIDAVLPR